MRIHKGRTRFLGGVLGASLLLAPAGRAAGLVVDARDGIGAWHAAALGVIAGVELDFHSPTSTPLGILVGEGDPAAVSRAVERLAGHPWVESAEPSVEFRIQLEVATATPVFRSPVTHPGAGDLLRRALLAPLGILGAPDDPLYKHQWHMRTVGAEASWQVATGKGVVVAVIDTGVAFEDHGSCKRMQDLAVTEFVEGYDVLGRSPHAIDENSHGTHVAGTIAQSTDNGFGVVGLARDAAIMPVRVLTASGAGTSAGIADGIRWAADHGADVANLSLGAHFPAKVVEDAVAYAIEKGMVIVAAAGNSGRRGVAWPAAYDGVIAVAATDLGDAPTFYTSYGPQVAIAAPGGDVREDKDGDGYPDGVLQNTFPFRQPDVTDEFRMFMGTSMAAPHVAGAAAQVVEVLRRKGVAKAEMPERVRDVLQAAARKAPDGSDPEKYGAGILDAAAAVRLAAED